MSSLNEKPCFLFRKGEWTIGEWYHRVALVEYVSRQSSNPSTEIQEIHVDRPDSEPFMAYFSMDEDRIFFMELSAESTDDIVFITFVLPVI